MFFFFFNVSDTNHIYISLFFSICIMSWSILRSEIFGVGLIENEGC